MDALDVTIGRITDENISEGFAFMLEVLLNRHVYSRAAFEKPEWSEPVYIGDKLPISDVDVWFVGREGYTSSIGAFVRIICEHLGNSAYWGVDNPIRKLRFLKLDADPENPDQHMIFGSVVFDDDDEYMVGGCTDHSGEGGRGGKLLYSFLALLSKLFGRPITVEHYGGNTYETVAEIIAQETAKQEEEEKRCTTPKTKATCVFIYWRPLYAKCKAVSSRGSSDIYFGVPSCNRIVRRWLDSCTACFFRFDSCVVLSKLEIEGAEHKTLWQALAPEKRPLYMEEPARQSQSILNQVQD